MNTERKKEIENEKINIVLEFKEPDLGRRKELYNEQMAKAITLKENSRENVRFV